MIGCPILNNSRIIHFIDIDQMFFKLRLSLNGRDCFALEEASFFAFVLEPFEIINTNFLFLKHYCAR